MFGAQTGRAAVGVLAVAGLLGLAACGATPQTTAERSTSPSRSASPSAEAPSKAAEERIPVAEAGGVCKLLSYETAARGTGVEFDVAAAGKHQKSSTCVLQVYGHAYPDLTLTVSPTKADTKHFYDNAAPDGAKRVDKLGEAAYRALIGQKGKAGPAAEVGWLADGSILTLRHTHESGVSADQARVTASKLVTLARQVQSKR